MTHAAFFYGTLMAPEVLTRVICGVANAQNAAHVTVKPALLTGYRRRRVKGCDYPGITKNESSTVRGSYVTGLTDEDIRRLDVFEGDQYVRRKVTVKVWDKVDLEEDVADDKPGEEKVAETYVWEMEDDELEDAEWDFEHFRKEKMKRWMGHGSYDYGDGVDEGFADVDAAVGNDPTGGRGVNGHITNQLNAHGATA